MNKEFDEDNNLENNIDVEPPVSYEQDTYIESEQTGGSPGTSDNNRADNNDYYYYSDNTQKPQELHQSEPPKKKKSFIGQLVRFACLGLVFGLVAGGAMQGVNAVSGLLSGSNNSAISEADGSTVPGMTLGVVKTSAIDVQTIEATDVSEIVSEATPSIVAVTTVVQQTGQDFFGRTYSNEARGAGSGVIFSEADGTLYILTNYHVVEDSSSIAVTFEDESEAQATVKGYDSNADIAVLEVDMSQLSEETKSSIKVAVLGDSDSLAVGSGAIAIGNALGYGQSTTTGVISATEREVQLTDGVMSFIQTDAAINQGNSGGALLNTRGEVVGINTAKISVSGVEGMGYAIPINSVVETVGDIISGKTTTKTDDDTAYLGIVGRTVDEETANRYGYPIGIYITTVAQGSAAEFAGIMQGYVITEFNGSAVSSMEELQALLYECTPGQSVDIVVQIPDNSGQYTQEQSLTTILGSKSESNQ